MSARPKSPRKRKGFALPDTTDLDSVNAAQVALIRRVAQNQLDAREAYYISRMLEHRRRAISSATLWRQMKALEAQGRQMRGEEP